MKAITIVDMQGLQGAMKMKTKAIIGAMGGRQGAYSAEEMQLPQVAMVTMKHPKAIVLNLKPLKAMVLDVRHPKAMA